MSWWTLTTCGNVWKYNASQYFIEINCTVQRNKWQILEPVEWKRDLMIGELLDYFGGFYAMTKLHWSYSTKGIFDNVDYMEKSSCMKSLLAWRAKLDLCFLSFMLKLSLIKKTIQMDKWTLKSFHSMFSRSWKLLLLLLYGISVCTHVQVPSALKISCIQTLCPTLYAILYNLFIYLVVICQIVTCTIKTCRH